MTGFAPNIAGGAGGRVGASFIDLSAEGWPITADLSGELAATVVVLLPDAPVGTEDLALTMPDPAGSSSFQVLLLADTGVLPLTVNMTPSSSSGSVVNTCGASESAASLSLTCDPIYSGSVLWRVAASPVTVPGANFGSKVVDLSGETYPFSYALTDDDVRHATLSLVVPAATPGDTLTITSAPSSDLRGYFNLLMLGGGGSDPSPTISWPVEVTAFNPYLLADDAAVVLHAFFPQPGGGWGCRREPGTEDIATAASIAYDDTGNTYITGANVDAALAAIETKLNDLDSRVAVLEP